MIGAATNPPPEAGRCRWRMVDRADTVRWQGYLRGAAPARFRFRSLSPVFGGATLLLNARASGDALDLWTACPEGPVAMEARAEW